MVDSLGELAVTLSSDLYAHLRLEARRLGVPMRWLVASMVLDTFESKIASEIEAGTTSPSLG
jgi:hypothetical protein